MQISMNWHTVDSGVRMSVNVFRNKGVSMLTGLVRCSIFVVASLLTSNVAFCQATGEDGVDDVKGARWDFQAFDGDEVVEKGFFRVADKVIYKGKKKVGKVEAESRTETKFYIDGFEKLNGKVTFKKVWGETTSLGRHAKTKRWQAVKDQSDV